LAMEGHRTTPSAAGRILRPLAIAVATTLVTMASVLAPRPVRGAEEATEVWPELNLFKRTGATTRLYFVGAYAENKDSKLGTLDVAGYFDLTLRPMFRPSLRSHDWRARRYFWVRVGYDHIFKTEDRNSKETSEHRGIVAVLGRTWLPGRVFVEGRLRTDLRWIGSEYSTRYRARIEINRDFVVRGRAVTPYLQIEPFYDTRYDDWSRALYQVGVEIETRKFLHRENWDFRVERQNRAHFRLEPYVALQVDWKPERSVVTAFGIVARWYY